MKKLVTGLALLALSGGFLLSLESCGDECEGSKRVSAEFRTHNELYYFDKENGQSIAKTKIVEEDTFLLGSTVFFEALDQHAESYEWTVGSDPRKRTEKKFSLSFDDNRVLQESPISVKLKIKKAPDLKCFPDDSGVDSVRYLIYFLPVENWPILGKYRGADDTDPNTVFTIEIYRDNIGDLFITNLPNACNSVNKNVRLTYSTAFEFTMDIIPATDLNCFFWRNDKKIGGLLPNRKNILIDYEFTEGGVDDTQRKHRVFKGIRI